jgi:serine/threonine-protein kinase RsbW
MKSSIEPNAMNSTKVSYILDSTLASVNKAEAAARTIALRSGFDEEDSERISMAVREATVNAVLHGNEYDPYKHVTVLFEAVPERFTVWVRDEGGGVDAADIPDPLAPEDLLKESGRGIFLIRAFMDEVRVRNIDPGTEITMIKHVRGATRDGQEASK